MSLRVLEEYIAKNYHITGYISKKLPLFLCFINLPLFWFPVPKKNLIVEQLSFTPDYDSLGPHVGLTVLFKIRLTVDRL